MSPKKEAASFKIMTNLASITGAIDKSENRHVPVIDLPVARSFHAC